MMEAINRDEMLARVVGKLNSLAEQKDAEISNLPESDREAKQFLRGMATAYRMVITHMEAGDWV